MELIPILDCGAQYGHLIARAVRGLGVYSEIVPPTISKLPEGTKGIIISGGPSSVYDDSSPKPDKNILSLGVPVLGICYGHQWLAHACGGEVRSGGKEYGHSKATILGGSIMQGLGKREDVWMSHGDSVIGLPPGFEVLASTESCRIAAYGNDERRLYGVQFHPEVAHTKNGGTVLRNFIYGICGCKGDWHAENNITRAVKEIKDSVGKSRAIIALSGGVDSATAAALASKAIGGNLIAFYVDTGLMREGETESVRRTFGNYPGMSFHEIDASAMFLKSLRNVSDPEKKRNIIGDLFADLFEDALGSFHADYLFQGTLYTDRIESAQPSGNASRIKTHHNVGSPEIERLRREGRIIEPLRDLYKDGVREVAAKLGLPPEIVNRQPFPGPGLAVRIEGPVTKNKLSMVRYADKIVTDEIERACSLRRSELPWQYFAVLTGSRRTGLKGDERAYGNVVVVRAVESREGMTVNAKHLEWDVLDRIASRVTNEIPGITGVCYEITSKPPATIEWE